MSRRVFFNGRAVDTGAATLGEITDMQELVDDAEVAAK